jgi:hypothetical protein
LVSRALLSVALAVGGGILTLTDSGVVAAAVAAGSRHQRRRCRLLAAGEGIDEEVGK